jgi:ferredoxin-NADP reductase
VTAQLAMASRPRGLERHRVRVLAARRPSDSLVELLLERPPQYTFEAGQFTYVFLPDAGEKRAYSIASAPYEADHLALCVKRVEGGPASTYLYGLQVGDEVDISLALGGFRFRTPPGTPAVFLCTGTGVAPLRSMIRQLVHQGDRRDLWLFLGSRELPNLPFRHDLELLSVRHRTFRYVPALSRAPLLWEGDRGWIQEAYLKRFYQPRPHHAYVCGVKRMVDDVRLLLQERGLPTEAIHVERYD